MINKIIVEISYYDGDKKVDSSHGAFIIDDSMDFRTRCSGYISNVVDKEVERLNDLSKQS